MRMKAGRKSDMTRERALKLMEAGFCFDASAIRRTPKSVTEQAGEHDNDDNDEEEQVQHESSEEEDENIAEHHDHHGYLPQQNYGYSRQQAHAHQPSGYARRW